MTGVTDVANTISSEDLVPHVPQLIPQLLEILKGAAMPKSLAPEYINAIGDIASAVNNAVVSPYVKSIVTSFQSFLKPPKVKSIVIKFTLRM